jgi:hypothetical protein
MIYIYGDSHANFCFKNLNLDHKNYFSPSVTMFRIGRDNSIINFNKDEIHENDVTILVYGEVDCRCHLQRQINDGRNEDDIINELVNSYFQTIKNNTFDKNLKIIIVGVIPPTKKCEQESINGPITHDFPFIGSDEDRVRYTNKVNKKLEEHAINNKYIYFNPYSYYAREDGTLNFELSDLNVHLGDNSHFLEKFEDLYKSFS